MPTFTIAQRNHDLDAHNAKLLAQLAKDAAPDTPMRPTLSRLGDDRVMRAIPVIAHGVGGTVPGTNPLQALMAKQPDDR